MGRVLTKSTPDDSHTRVAHTRVGFSLRATGTPDDSHQTIHPRIGTPDDTPSIEWIHPILIF